MRHASLGPPASLLRRSPIAATPHAIRILLIADSHLGFDHPVRPRIQRRRRGHDFLANYGRALETATSEAVDLVVHGGDLFHRPDVPASLVHQAFDPLKRVADAGIPVFLVPGNHERSRIPFDWLARHPGVHVFGAERTVRTEIRGTAVAVSGVPCIRRRARARFPAALDRTRWRDSDADIRLLVAHQAFEGAVVGPADFTFRTADDVVRLADLPPEFAAVLAGHIHRSQVLETDLRGRPCPVPVLYPGSVERTAFAEKDEPKGFLVLTVSPDAGGAVAGWTFRSLDARPMVVRPLRVEGLDETALEAELRRVLAAEPPDAVLRLEADGAPMPGAEGALRAARLRELAPETMNVEVRIPGVRPGRRRRAASDGSRSRGAAGRTARSEPAQKDLFER